MFGQFFVELEPEPEPEEFDEPELVPELVLVLLDPLDPVLAVLELDDGVVVDELVLAAEPVVPVVAAAEVVAALATSAPPVTSPVVSAPMANTLRSRIFMIVALSFGVLRPPVRAGMHTVRPGPVDGRNTAAARWLGFLTIG
jgi:hypothetical protein